MHFHDLILAVGAFVSEVLGTLSGFGSSTFFVPVAQLLESFKFVLALTAILHCFSNIFKIFIFRKDFQWKTVLRFALPAFIFTVLGALLTTQFSSRWLAQGLGVALVLISVLAFFKNKTQHLPKWVELVLISISGFSTGLVGTGGAIRGMALMASELSKNTFVVVSAAIDVGGDLLRALIYISNGFMDWSQWFYIPLLLLAAWAGASVGRFLLDRINQRQFEKIVTVFIFLSGLTMIFEK